MKYSKRHSIENEEIKENEKIKEKYRRNVLFDNNQAERDLRMGDSTKYFGMF
ncbi:hypothetical protein [Methanosarcina siciliae]|uniref:hypothetical protein n=1 Tax=Methanosarcina siciliae TaxID=38027 RepID=UPI000B20D97F